MDSMGSSKYSARQAIARVKGDRTIKCFKIDAQIRDDLLGQQRN